MFTPVYTRQFERDLERIKKRQKKIEKLKIDDLVKSRTNAIIKKNDTHKCIRIDDLKVRHGFMTIKKRIILPALTFYEPIKD